MTSLLNLPDEILEQIAEDVPASFVATSRRLHAIALPHHYRVVALAPHTLLPFLRTAFSSSRLLTYTRKLSVDLFNSSTLSSLVKGGLDVIDLVARKLMPFAISTRALLTRDSAEFRSVWKKHPGQLALHLLMYLVPSVETLSIDFPRTDRMWILQLWHDQICPSFRRLKAHLKPPPALASVRDLSISTRHTRDSLGLEDALPFFSLPSLRHLSISCCAYGPSYAPPLLHELTGRGAFTSLTFVDSYLDLYILSCLVDIAPSGQLRSLSYNISNDYPEGHQFNGPLFVNNLRDVRKTLVSLTLLGTDGKCSPMDIWTRCFPALQELIVDARYWTSGALHEGSMRGVPPHLKHLCVHMVSTSLMVYESHLAAVVRETPSLEVMCVGLQPLDSAARSLPLAKACGKSKVELKYFSIA